MFFGSKIGQSLLELFSCLLGRKFWKIICFDLSSSTVITVITTNPAEISKSVAECFKKKLYIKISKIKKLQLVWWYKRGMHYIPEIICDLLFYEQLSSFWSWKLNIMTFVFMVFQTFSWPEFLVAQVTCVGQPINVRLNMPPYAAAASFIGWCVITWQTAPNSICFLIKFFNCFIDFFLR